MKDIKYKLFPKIEEVFVDVTDNHRAVFFPLLTIDLKSINKGSGKVHFVCYFRNGEPDEIIDPNFGYNFIRFEIVKNDKYKFNGDFDKIYLFDKSIKWYKEAQEIYKKHKKLYFEKSDFVKEEDKRRMKIDFEYYYYIKGILNYWVTKDKYIETKKFIQGGAYTYGNSNHERKIIEDIKEFDNTYPDEILEEVLAELNLELKDLDYIGRVTGYNYLEIGADEINLFKKDNEVFIYYNWS